MLYDRLAQDLYTEICHVPIIDPMEFQADAVIGALNKMRDTTGFPDLSSRSPDLTPVVFTTGDLAKVTQSAHQLLDPMARVFYTEFGPGFDVTLTNQLFVRPNR